MPRTPKPNTKTGMRQLNDLRGSLGFTPHWDFGHVVPGLDGENSTRQTQLALGGCTVVVFYPVFKTWNNDVNAAKEELASECVAWLMVRPYSHASA